jgi:hypothetical protein
MVNIKIGLKNPWYKNGNKLPYHLFCFEPKISKNKAICIQLSNMKSNYYLFDFYISTDFRGRDHAGPVVHIDIMGLFFMFQFYDVRHWDFENDCWET